VTRYAYEYHALILGTAQDGEEKYMVNPCLFCQSEQLAVAHEPVRRFVVCLHCHASGPTGENYSLAVQFWNIGSKPSYRADMNATRRIRRRHWRLDKDGEPLEVGDCPFCDSGLVALASNGHRMNFWMCDGCGATGPTAPTIEAATVAWSKPERQRLKFHGRDYLLGNKIELPTPVYT
jgi:transcription elongation factor Elf1